MLGSLSVLKMDNVGLSDVALAQATAGIGQGSLEELHIQRNHVTYDGALGLAAAAAGAGRPIRLNLDMLLLSEAEIATLHAAVADCNPKQELTVAAEFQWFNPNDPMARR